MNLPDQEQRDRFCREIGHSFSVVAPAGVGKTRAIVDRVVAIARREPAVAMDILPRLVVVTYTNKAADEMHQRARNAILAAGVDLPVLAAFNRAFFGTIHSFCVRLLRQFGDLAKAPSPFEVAETDEELWRAFIQQYPRVAPALDSDVVRTVMKLVPVDQLYAIARHLSERQWPEVTRIGDVPELNLMPIYRAKATRKNAENNIEKAKRLAQQWEEAWKQGTRFAPLPTSPSGSKEFLRVWNECFAPLVEWRRQAAYAVACAMARDFQKFRLQRGRLTFGDQVRLALQLVRNPESIRRIRQERFCVILDEAQDTDPDQFRILIEIARPENARGEWPADGADPPEPGRFCIVGDPQQAIYSSRIDLDFYNRVRQALAKAPKSYELVFSVTFRCDKRIIEVVNALVAPMFGSDAKQVLYTPSSPRPNAGPGLVLKWMLNADNNSTWKVNDATIIAGKQLAEKLREIGLVALGATRWSDVAVLCPRNRWLPLLAYGLAAGGLACQVHTERQRFAERPVYAWLAGLLVALTRRTDGFELMGVLRELYGFPDEELARWAWVRKHTWRWDLSDPPNDDAAVSQIVRELSRLAQDAQSCPLRDALELIIERTQLAERVLALRDPIYPTRKAVVEDLDAIRIQAAEAEQKGLSLAEWAERFARVLGQAAPDTPPAADSVQLLTMHKAKGLEWPVVIVPLLNRPIGESTQYPKVIPRGLNEPPLVAFGSDDARQGSDELNDAARREYQRLIYVALTRAKHTLIVTEDVALYGAKGKQSIATLLGLNGDLEPLKKNAELFSTLPSKPESGAAPTAASSTSEGTQEIKAASPAPLPLPPPERERAFSALKAAVARTLPYRLAEEAALPVAEEEALGEAAERGDELSRSAVAEAARAYGIWWHKTLESFPWTATAMDQAAYWKRALDDCPDPSRGEQEATLLLRSELARCLTRSELRRRAEVPFLWRTSASSCVEGIIDLAVWDPAKEQWLVVDWKTNRVSLEEAPKILPPLYAPQLRAYANALAALTNKAVRFGIYSTSTGLWLDLTDFKGAAPG